MCKFLYKWIAETRAQNLDLKLKDAIRTMEKCDVIRDANSIKGDESCIIEGNDGTFSTVDEASIFAVKKEVAGNEGTAKTSYNIFFGNIHIHVSIKESQKIYSIRIKAPEDKWIWGKYADNPDDINFSRPLTNTFEIYVWYKVPVLDVTTSEGYLYKNGSWDKYFNKKISEFFSKVKAKTDSSIFNEYYKK